MKNLMSPAYPFDFCTNCAHYARGDGTFWVDDRDLKDSSARGSINLEKILYLHAKRLCQENDFLIRETTYLRFDFCNRVFGGIPSRPAASRGQHGLGKAALIAEFSDNRANDIFRNSLAHFGLDRIKLPNSISSENGRSLGTSLL
jgi:hypothetical protein